MFALKFKKLSYFHSRISEGGINLFQRNFHENLFLEHLFGFGFSFFEYVLVFSFAVF